MVIEAKKARKRLTFLWFIGCAILLLIFIIQHLNGKFEERSAEAWKWISSYTLSFITLVSGAFLMDMRNSITATVDKSFFYVSFISSLFYLLCLLLIVLWYPFSEFSEASIVDYYASCDIFLLTFQGIISGIIGSFFIKGYGSK